jgi:hypothetical protein
MWFEIFSLHLLPTSIFASRDKYKKRRMADFAAQRIVVCFISWQAGPGEALLCAAMWGGLGQVECVLL